MALSLATISSSLLTTLPISGMMGEAIPPLANGIAAGIVVWTRQVIISTRDTGKAGRGSGSVPLRIPLPTLLSGLLMGFKAKEMKGDTVPKLVLGIASGLAMAFAQGQIKTTHPLVGVGTAKATFPHVSAVPSMISGFKSNNMKGAAAEMMAGAVGMGIDLAFARFTIPPISIVGTHNGTSASGGGTGKLA